MRAGTPAKIVIAKTIDIIVIIPIIMPIVFSLTCLLSHISILLLLSSSTSSKNDAEYSNVFDPSIRDFPDGDVVNYIKEKKNYCDCQKCNNRKSLKIYL